MLLTIIIHIMSSIILVYIGSIVLSIMTIIMIIIISSSSSRCIGGIHAGALLHRGRAVQQVVQAGQPGRPEN